MTQGITEKDAERALSKWFIRARDRGGNRTVRAQRELQKKVGDWGTPLRRRVPVGKNLHHACYAMVLWT